MGKSIFLKIVLALVLLGAVAALGAFAFQAGLAQGMAQTVLVEGNKAGIQPPYAVPYMMPYGYHHFGMFGIFGLIIPFFLLVLIFSAIRGLFWGGHRGWHHMHHGPWGMHRGGDWEKGMDVPPVVEEWHRQMHEKQGDKPAEK